MILATVSIWLMNVMDWGVNLTMKEVRRWSERKGLEPHPKFSGNAHVTTGPLCLGT